MAPLSSGITVSNLTRFLCLAGALCLYGLFGLPTPDRPGVVEALIALGLIGAVGLPHAAFILRRLPEDRPLWLPWAQYLFLYSLTIPLSVAILAGHGPGLIIRDFVPFIFLVLPLFLFGFFQHMPPKYARFLIYLIGFAGLCFSLRGIGAMSVSREGIADIDALYLVNAPTVLFIAIGLSGMAVYRLSVKRPALFVIYGPLALIPMAAMALALQRASFGAIGLSLIMLWVLVLRQSLLRAGILVGLGALVFWSLQDQAAYVTDRLIEKHRSVGSNMRFLELQAVWEQVNHSLASMLFGQGWGALVRSPAVGGLSVNFTHSLLTAALLKTGLVGLGLTLAYLFTLGLRLPVIYKTSPVMAAALFWPFVIDIFLYASYKSLDFGLILLLIATYAYQRETEQPPEKTDIIDQPHLSARQGGHGTASG